jgi:hypothetical protein
MMEVMRFVAQAVLPIGLIAALASCAAPPAEPTPTFDRAPTATPTPEPTAPSPLNPCELITAIDRTAVFGSDLGEGSYAETGRSEMHQRWISSGCTWSSGGVFVNVELAEANDFPRYEVVCLEPFEPVVTSIDSVGDRSWTARVAAGTLVRGCSESAIADVTVSGSNDPLGDATVIARVLLAAVS